MMRLAIVTTHPIQYNAPLFKLLASRGKVLIKVFYTWGKSVLENKYDPGFNRAIEWDIPLLEGYDYCFVENIADQPGSYHFSGINNPGLSMAIENWNADSVLIYGWSFKSHIQCMRYFHKKIPVLFRGDSTLLDPQPVLKKILRFIFLTWVYTHIDFALYAGSNNRDYFKFYKVPENKLVHAPHAVDNARFFDNNENNYEGKAARWREHLNIKPSDTVFLFAGKLEEKKDPLLLINAFKQLQSADLHLVMAGNGPMEETLKKNAIGNIHFIEFQNQSMMPVLYRLADCVVLPSKGPGETWGLVINESMACARPIIASDKCGCAIDLISAGLNGYVFNSRNEDDLKKKMMLFAVEKNKGNNMRDAALASILPWSLGEICNQIEKIAG